MGEPLTEALDTGAAIVAAARQGSPVEVADLRTPTRTVRANPNGTLTADLTVLPTRVKRGDSWLPIDTTLVARPDGTIAPKAAIGDLALSGGGSTAPLARLTKDGRSFALYWPGALPTPQWSTTSVTYPEVLPGVDLVMHAEVNGYRQHLVIKTADAARNPELARLSFRVETEALRLTVADSGEVRAIDEAGAPVFVAPPSTMWDANSQVAPVGVALEGGSLVIRPDPRFLADPSVVFPVTVDPDMRTWDKNNWATVLSGKPTQSYWWTSGAGSSVAQVGQCYQGNPNECNNIGIARAYFQYDTSFLAGRRILGSVLNTVVVHSPNCSSYGHTLLRTNGQIDTGTNWNNAPAGVSGTDFTAAPRADCGQGSLAGIGTVNTGGLTTYFLKAQDEGAQLAWRKYDPAETRLSVWYNTGPYQPTELNTDPRMPTPCQLCNGTPYIADASIRLQARLSDPDNDLVKPKWIIYTNEVPEERWGVLQISGAMHDTPVDLNSRNGKRVRWQVQTWDTRNGDNNRCSATDQSDCLDASSWAFSSGSFVVDRDAPGAPPVVQSKLYPQDNRWHGGVGVSDTFTFKANGVSDIDHYLYGWTSPPTNRLDAPHLGGDASVVLTPPGDGPRDLFVQSVDRAGNRSTTTQHHFFVRAGKGPLGQWSMEGNAQDDAFLGDHNGTVTGLATWGPGAVGAAIELSGASFVTVPLPPTLRTDLSFSAAAWVRLDEGGAPRMAVSQLGSRVAGFQLGYRPGNGGHWVFEMAQSTGDNPELDTATSTQTTQLGMWTHLAGVYDATTGQQRLYVNGVLAGTSTHTMQWNATGETRIGASRWNAAKDFYWRGAIDEVRNYDRVVAEAELKSILASDNVHAGQWRFDDDRTLDGQLNTVARNSVEGGDTGTLTGGATFTDQGAVKGAVQFDGVDDQVVMSRPAVRTDQSFSVAAWVKADRLVTGGHMTAVSQEGSSGAGFALQYNGGHQKWLFLMRSADSDTFTWGGAVSSQQPVTGQWVHLAGVYNAAAQRLQVYVNGDLGGSTSWTSTWNATGPLAVGRGKWLGGPREFWPGAIDEVRMYSRALSESEIRAIVSQDNVTAGSWKLDGNANDSSGRNLHGTVIGNPQWTPGQSSYPDPADSALTLDGTDDYVRTSPVVDTSKSFSVGTWVKLTEKRAGWNAVLSQSGSVTAAFNLGYSGSGLDRWAFAMHGPDAEPLTAVTRIFSAQPAQAGVWTHLAAVYDSVSGEMRLYVNGILSATGTFGAPWNATGAFDIGRAKWVGNFVDYLAGTVDDVVAYSRPLFSEEIRTLAGRDLNLIHNWRLDEATGTTAADAVGARPATLTGGPTFAPGRGGNSILLDGIDDTASTTAVDLRTDQNFTVAAWVYLSAADRTATAVSLDGAQSSKFRLGHVVDDVHPDGVWIFECPEPDGTSVNAAVSVLSSEVGTWVHLVGVYDAQTHTIWLYVNGDRIDSGTVNTPWQATGGLQIGRGKVDGVPAQFWSGSVDDVRLYTGALDKDRARALHRSYPVGS